MVPCNSFLGSGGFTSGSTADFSSDTKKRESYALSSTRFFSWSGLAVVENGLGFVDVVGFGVEGDHDVSRVDIFLNFFDGCMRR